MHLKFAFHKESKLHGGGEVQEGGVATTVCACVAVAFAIASSCGNLQFSAWSGEAPKFVDSGGRGRAVPVHTQSEALSMGQHTLRMRDKCA